MRTTLLGSLLDVAAPQPLARDARTCGCSRSAPSTSAPGRAPARTPTGRPRQPGLEPPARGAHAPRRAADRRDAAAVVARARAAARRLLRRQGRARRRCCGALRVPLARRAGARAVPAPGPRRARAGRRRARPAGSASCTRRSPRAWDLDARVAGFELDLGVCSSARRRRPALRGPHLVPGRAPGPRRGRSRADVPAADVIAVVREAGGALLRARRGLRRLPRRAGRRGPRVARAAARVPRRRPHADRRGGRASGARRSSPRVARARSGASCVAERSPSSARAATPARSRRALLHRHPHFELAHVTARCEAGERLDDVHPRTRVPLVLEELRPRRARPTSTPRSSCYPHGAAAPAVAALRERGVRVVDLSRRLPAARPRRSTRTGTASTARPSCSASAVYGLPELHRDAIARRRPRRQPRLLPDRRAARARAARPRRAARRRRDRREVRRVAAPAASRRATKHFIAVDETSRPYKVGGHRHTPEIEQELARAGDVRVTFTPAPRPARPGRAGLLLRDAARETARTSCRALRRRLRARAVGRAASTARPACSRCARPTTAASRCTATRARAGSSCSRRSTTCGRAPRRRRSRTST